jgi:hypothetical protein
MGRREREKKGKFPSLFHAERPAQVTHILIKCNERLKGNEIK